MKVNTTNHARHRFCVSNSSFSSLHLMLRSTFIPVVPPDGHEPVRLYDEAHHLGLVNLVQLLGDRAAGDKRQVRHLNKRNQI